MERAGHRVRCLLPEEPVCDEADIVFTYAPYGRWMQIPRQLSRMPAERRPFLIHWNTEGMAPPYLPLQMVKRLGLLRSRLDEHLGAYAGTSPSAFLRNIDGFSRHRILRYRYLGDYLQLQKMGIPFLLAEISALHSGLLERLGVNCLHVPIGSSLQWYADLDLPRDIDVLWIGSHGSRRRFKLLKKMQAALQARGIRFHVADGQQAPFVHGDERTVLLNRSKIVLNLMRTPYDDNTLRHFIAMPNRALVISEPMLRHNPALQPGTHYIEASLREIPDTIRYYLDHDELRAEIVERAHRVTTGSLSMENMVQRILRAAAEKIGPADISASD